MLIPPAVLLQLPDAKRATARSRMFARTLDQVFVGGILLPMLWPFFGEMLQMAQDRPGSLLLAYVVPSMLYEIVCLPYMGATLGKRIFGLRVLRADGALPNWHDASWRFIWFFLLGTAANIPVLSGIANLMAYLRIRRTGSATWDERCGLVVVKSNYAL